MTNRKSNRTAAAAPIVARPPLTPEEQRAENLKISQMILARRESDLIHRAENHIATLERALNDARRAAELYPNDPIRRLTNIQHTVQWAVANMDFDGDVVAASEYQFARTLHAVHSTLADGGSVDDLF